MSKQYHYDIICGIVVRQPTSKGSGQNQHSIDIPSAPKANNLRKFDE